QVPHPDRGLQGGRVGGQRGPAQVERQLAGEQLVVVGPCPPGAPAPGGTPPISTGGATAGGAGDRSDGRVDRVGGAGPAWVPEAPVSAPDHQGEIGGGNSPDGPAPSLPSRVSARPSSSVVP